METNVGSTDRLVRALVGAVVGLVGLAALAGVVDLATVVALIAVVVGVVMVGTALTQTCLVYSLLGVNTCKRA